MEQKSNAFLEKEKVGTLMRKYAVPCIISLLVAAFYNIVDQIFIANASYLGSYGNAANTVVFPLTVVALAVAVMIGDGCCAFVSISLGADEKENAHRSIGSAVVLCILASVLLTALYFLFRDPILTMFGGRVNEETFRYSKEYFIYISMGIPFYMFGQAMNPIIRSDGSPRFAMASTLAGAVVNIILDPVFIFGWLGLPAMGVAGAAWATVIGQFCGMAVGIGINHVKNHEVRLNFRRFRPDWHSIKGIYQVGLPSIIMQSIGSVMTFGMNKILIAFTETAVSVFGVYFKLQSFVFMPVFGVTNALVPIVGYNYGARSSQRIQQATRLSLLMTTAIMALGTVIFQVAPGPLLSLFSASDTMLSIGIPALRIISVSFCFAGVAIVFSSVFQALGDGMLSLVMSAVRQLLLLLPCAFVLAKLGGLDAVWFSFLIAEVASVTLAVVFYRSLYNKKIRHI